MKITNSTVWRTDHLRAILQRAAEMELEPEQRKVLHVHVSYTRGHYSSGCAFVKGRHATVRIRHPQSRSNRTQMNQAELLAHFASVAVHEFAHIRGMTHDVMPANYKWHGRWRDYVSWAEGMPLEMKAAPTKRIVTLDDKLGHVLAMKARAETRLKRAATILKKWKARERYYVQAARKAK